MVSGEGEREKAVGGATYEPLLGARHCLGISRHIWSTSPDNQEVGLRRLSVQSHRAEKKRQNSKADLSDSKALPRTTSHTSARAEGNWRETGKSVYCLSLRFLIYIMELNWRIMKWSLPGLLEESKEITCMSSLCKPKSAIQMQGRGCAVVPANCGQSSWDGELRPALSTSPKQHVFGRVPLNWAPCKALDTDWPHLR